MKTMLFLSIVSNLGLGYVAVKTILELKKVKEEKEKKRITKVVPRLSELHGKLFSSYMNELNDD